MTRIVHLSDLHYGRDREDLEAPLLAAIETIEPELVVISGDFTQRARVSQFARAQAFLDRLAVPWLAVPGNHDTPLDNLWVRMVAPWKRYKQAIDRDLEPRYESERLVVVGVNTVNRFAWQRGKLSERRIRRTCKGFEGAGERARIAVLHHPLEHGPEVEKRLMQGADAALDAFCDCGAQIVLSGHLHNTIVAPFRARPELLFVQAGTSLSSRVRGEVNTFNVLEITTGGVRVETLGFDGEGFSLLSTSVYARDGKVWQPVVGPQHPEISPNQAAIVSTVSLPLV